MPVVFFSDPPTDPFKQRNWLMQFRDYVLYGETSGGETEPVPANQVYAGPTAGGAIDPVFRNLVAADIPNLDANKITTGTLGTARIPNLDTAKITTGVFANARINFAEPAAIGGTTPAAGTFTALTVLNAAGAMVNLAGGVSNDSGIKWYSSSVADANLRWHLLQDDANALHLRAYDGTGAFMNYPLIINKTDSSITTPYAISGSAATFTGNLQARYGKITGSGNTYFDINGGSNNDRMLRYYTSNSLRWEWKVNGNEAGTDQGSNFTLSAYSDNGTSLINNVLKISRKEIIDRIVWEGSHRINGASRVNGNFTVNGDQIDFDSATDGFMTARNIQGLFRTVSVMEDAYNPLYIDALTFTNATGTPSNTTTHQGYIKFYIGSQAKYIRYYE